MEALEEIRRDPEFANLLVAVLSSSVSPEDKNSVAALERTCFITKPLDLAGVGTTINQEAVSGRQSERSGGGLHDLSFSLVRSGECEE